MTVLLIAWALVAVELITAARSPLRFRDDDGFDFGRELAALAGKVECENPSLVFGASPETQALLLLCGQQNGPAPDR